MRPISQNIILVMIILFAALLRFFNLSTIPIGFNDDEAAFGYNAYSIQQTGRDEWGRFLPFPTFESFGDWKLVGYLYPVVISQFFLGTNEFATRFPSAGFGVLAVFATYLLTKKLFEDKTSNSDSPLITHHSSLKSVALLATLFLAISPWHIVASRNAFESDILIFFITLSTYFFLRSIERSTGRKKYITLATLGFVFSFYIYRSSWLFVPLFVLTLIWLYREHFKKLKNYLAKNLLLAIILLLPLVPTATTFKGQSRFFQESFLSGIQKTGIIDDVNQRRGNCRKSWLPPLCLAVYNKYTFYLSTYFNNYISNLSPETYYVKGNPGGYQSFSIRSLFYTFELPLLISGLYFLIIKRSQAAKILIPWILIAPLGASLTGIGNPGRLNILMPTPQIVAAFGFVSLLALFKIPKVRAGFLLITLLIIFSSTIRLLADQFVHYPKISGKYQRYGYKQLFEYLESQKNNYDQIIVSRASDDAKQYIHYLFYTKTDPRLFHDQAYTIKYRGADNWQQVERIGNINFYKETPDIDNLPAKTLLAVAHNETTLPAKPIFQVKYLNDDVAFEVYDVDQVKLKLNEK